MESTFHLSLPCSSVKNTKAFYINILGASSGREAEHWIDINLFGNQITFTKAGKFNFNNPNYVFEGKILPSFHFGIILEQELWDEIHEKLKKQKLELVTESIFLKNKNGEHRSFFMKDPNNYMIEFKCFKNENAVFNK